MKGSARPGGHLAWWAPGGRQLSQMCCPPALLLARRGHGVTGAQRDGGHSGVSTPRKSSQQEKSENLYLENLLMWTGLRKTQKRVKIKLTNKESLRQNAEPIAA